MFKCKCCSKDALFHINYDENYCYEHFKKHYIPKFKKTKIKKEKPKKARHL